jgi:hypothetical protein
MTDNRRLVRKVLAVTAHDLPRLKPAFVAECVADGLAVLDVEHRFARSHGSSARTGGFWLYPYRRGVDQLIQKCSGRFRQRPCVRTKGNIHSFTHDEVERMLATPTTTGD